MTDKNEDKPGHVHIETNPDADAEAAARMAKGNESHRAPTKGVQRVGGGDHGKTEKGVKVVKR